MAVTGSNPVLDTPITHCNNKAPIVYATIGASSFYTSSANQIPHRRNTLTIVSKHVHRIRHNSASEHLTTLNAHIQPKNAGVIGMTLTIGIRIRITKNRVSLINDVGINNEVYHRNHLT